MECLNTFKLRWEDGKVSNQLSVASVWPVGDDFEEPRPGSAVIGGYRGARYNAVIESIELSGQNDESSQVRQLVFPAVQTSARMAIHRVTNHAYRYIMSTSFQKLVTQTYQPRPTQSLKKTSGTTKERRKVRTNLKF